MTDGVLIAACWLGWCALHSLLIWPGVSERLQGMLGERRYLFRMLYSSLSVVTLFPPVLMTALFPGGTVFVWSGGWRMLQLMLLLAALWLFWSGARHYDLALLFGLRQIRERRLHGLLSGDGHFTRRGVLGMTRHPWYLGSLFFLWSFLPVYHRSSFIAATVLSVYLVTGTLLEEHKLVVEHGERYRSYQREVSMLFPWKWLKRKVLRR